MSLGCIFFMQAIPKTTAVHTTAIANTFPISSHPPFFILPEVIDKLLTFVTISPIL